MNVESVLREEAIDVDIIRVMKHEAEDITIVVETVVLECMNNHSAKSAGIVAILNFLAEWQHWQNCY